MNSPWHDNVIHGKELCKNSANYGVANTAHVHAVRAQILHADPSTEHENIMYFNIHLAIFTNKELGN